ncbi:MAG: hypothetical protein F6J97_07800 [Leptolyngbya sp. SIO4C1]|nr:hypothetical protein [Leptolyngbya sp. SIO4C1]
MISSLQDTVRQLRTALSQGESFNPARWDHWLLIACFLALASWGLWLSRKWRKESKRRL